jgi:hypothetical protein
MRGPAANCQLIPSQLLVRLSCLKDYLSNVEVLHGKIDSLPSSIGDAILTNTCYADDADDNHCGDDADTFHPSGNHLRSRSTDEV